MVRDVRWIALALLLLVAVGCGLRRTETDINDEAARVSVINRSAEHMTIYVYRGAERHRLGVVSPGMDETFEIPSRLIIGVTTLRFTAERPGVRAPYAAQDFNVAPGSHIEMIIR